jgi:hypothetical protein
MSRRSNGFERALAWGNFLAERLPLKAISSYYLMRSALFRRQVAVNRD